MKHWSVRNTGIFVFTVSIMASFHLDGDVADPLDDDLYCQVTEKMNRVTDIARQGRTHIDRAAFDIEEKLDRLDYDAETIVEFSRRSIAFEQYSGSLRGPKGTLLSLAGNALDQSLLLGKLLRDAGYEARIAGATLGVETTTALLQQMSHPITRSASGRISEELLTSLAKLTEDKVSSGKLREQLEASADPKTDPDYKKVQQTTRFILEALGGAGIEPAGPGEGQTLIEEARDYYWVQYRELAADDWVNAHPAFADDPPGTIPEPDRFLAGAVPEDLLHRIRLQFFIERSTGGKLEALPISAAWERPAANLVDTPVSFSVFPIGISPKTMLEKGVSKALDNSAIFATVFNGSAMPDGKYFDLKGNIIDPLASSNSAAGVFATVGDRFGSATSAMGGDVPTLTAHWLQITVIAPDGTESSFRRTTLDRIGPAARARGNSPVNLTQTTSEEARDLLHKHTIMIATGSTPASLVYDRGFDWMLRAEPMYRQLREQVAYRARDDLESPKIRPVDDLPGHWPGHLGLFSVFDRANSLLDSHRVYRARPGIVIHVHGQKSNDALFEMIDIVTNARRAVVVNDGMPRLDPKAVVIAGVWDTAKEGSLLKPGDTRVNTETVFTDALAKGKRMVTLAPGKPISGVTLSPDIEALVQSDLSRGFAIVLPDDQHHVENAAWWRVNPKTGETVGQAMDGRGATAAETLAVLATAVTAIVVLYGLDQCHQDYQRCNDLRFPMKECSDKYWCCNGLGFATTLIGVFAFASNALYSLAWDYSTTSGPSVCN